MRTARSPRLRQPVAIAALVAVVVTASWTVLAAPASAQSPTPSASPSSTPVVQGSITGSRSVGDTISFRVDVTVPGGWDRLHLVDVALEVGGREADRISYDIEDAIASLGGTSVVAGTGASASGRYLEIAGSRLVLTTGGGHLSFLVDAEVLQEIPTDARYELSVTGDRGERVAVERMFARRATDTGPTWAAVGTAVLVALLAGGFVGNLFASKRRPPQRASVYGTISRRIEAERRAGGKG